MRTSDETEGDGKNTIAKLSAYWGSLATETEDTHEHPPLLLRQYFARFQGSSLCCLHLLFGFQIYWAASVTRAKYSGSLMLGWTSLPASLAIH